MDLRELYSGKLLQETFQRLQNVRIAKKDSPVYHTKVEGPEIFKDSFLLNWLALNYLFTVGFDHQRTPLMGEIGGIIATRKDKGKKILGISEASITKVMYGIQRVQDSRRLHDDTLLSQLEV